MFRQNLKIIIFALGCLIFIFGPNLVFAQKLEIQYPPVPFPGVETPNEFIQKIEAGVYPAERTLPLYIKYFYYLFLTIVGLVAFGVIVYGGLQYLVSFGAPVKMVAAKDQIVAGFLGLIILLSSYLILTTINPQLAVFRLPGLAPPPIEIIEIKELKEEIPVYFQIPTGTIIENAVINKIGQQKMADVKKAAEEARKAAKKLKDKTAELKTITDACRCNNTRCAPPPSCLGVSCPQAKCDKPAIESKIREIKLAIKALEEKREKVILAKIPLVDDLSQLEAAGLLMSLEYEKVFSYNDLLSIKHYYEEVEIDSFPDWKNIDLKINARIVKDPITFYLDKKGNKEAIYFASVYRWTEGAGSPPEPPGGWPTPPPPEPGKLGLPLPLGSFRCSSDFNHYRGYNKCHNGIDFPANFDTPIYAAANGKVVYIGYYSTGGNLIIIKHEGLKLSTAYAHLSSFNVALGETVIAGQLIGWVNNTGYSTGNHLHFEVRNGLAENANSFFRNFNALDPKNYLSLDQSIIQQCYDWTMNNGGYCQ